VFFPTVQVKTLWAVEKGFLNKGVSVGLWLLLFRCGKALEVFWVSGESWGVSRQNRSDRFVKMV
jgi:hypothetical protein